MDAAGVWLLCERLRSEKLMVVNEQNAVSALHAEMGERMEKLGLLTWNTRLYQWTLEGLLRSHPSVQPDNAFAVLSTIDAAKVEKAWTRLPQHHSIVEAVLRLLYSSPRSVAELLVSVEQHQGSPYVSDLPRALFSLVYGHCVFPADEVAVLRVLGELVDHGLAGQCEPRNVLLRGRAAFPRLYKLFTEGLFSAKVFLTASLHQPVMEVLCQDSIFLDIDPQKSPQRLTSAERERRFGTDPNSKEYLKRLNAHRNDIVEKLVLLTHSFIKSICDSLHCLPPGLVWLIKRLHTALIERKNVNPPQASLICTDLLVTNLICTAIAKPDTVGVLSDTPLSTIARHNLMQIGQILQTLAISRHEPPARGSPLAYFAAQFAESPIIDVVGMVLAMVVPPLDELPEARDDFFKRTHFMGSLADVNSIVAAVQGAGSSSITDAVVKKELTRLVRRLPPTPFSTPTRGVEAAGGERGRQHLSPPAVARTANKLSNLAQKVGKGRLAPTPSLPLTGSSSASSLKGLKSMDLTDSNGCSENGLSIEMFDVIIFDIIDPVKEIGMQKEEVFLANARKERRQKEAEATGEKRTRFLEENASCGIGSSAPSEYTENGSDTGDEGEEEEEATSIASSIEDQREHDERMLLMDEDGASTLPDNVSEMMSGRGTPSLSGRETPLSQSAQEENSAPAGGPSSTVPGGSVDVAARQALPPLPVTVRKQNAEGLEEKFGKFSLGNNRPYRDDQRSLLSDSWSTDVVASDNEGPTAAALLPHHLLQQQVGLAPPHGGHLAASGNPAQLLPLLPHPVAHAPPLNQNQLQAVPPDQFLNGGGPTGAQQRASRLTTRSGSMAGAEDRSDTWSLDAIASDSEADRNEGSRNGADHRGGIIDDPTPSSAAVATAPPSANTAAPGAGGVLRAGAGPNEAPDEVPRLRRQSSGSSFYSKSDSEFGRDDSTAADSAEKKQTTVVRRVSLKTEALPEDDSSQNEEQPCSSRQAEQQNYQRFTSNERHEIGSGQDISDSLNEAKRRGIALFMKVGDRIGEKFRRGGGASAFTAVSSSSSSPRMAPSSLLRQSATIADLHRATGTAGGIHPPGRGISESQSSNNLDNVSPDDILAKYAARPSEQPLSGRLPQQQPSIHVDISQPSPDQPPQPHTLQAMADAAANACDGKPYYTPENVTQCQAFMDAKHKLRVVLSEVNLPPSALAARGDAGVVDAAIDQDANGQPRLSSDETVRDQLFALLKLLLAEAISSRETKKAARLREAIRCLQVFDNNAKAIRKVLRSMRGDFRHRTAYMLHLQQSRLLLLRLNKQIERLACRVEMEKKLTEECIVEVLVRWSISNRRKNSELLQRFHDEFTRMVVQDEKSDCLNRTLSALWQSIEADPSWREAVESQREYARKCYERWLMASIFHIAFYPNSDADVYRDRMFHDELARIAMTLSPNHPLIRIPPELHSQCPWPYAQAEIDVINAYKSPRDKLACVTRMCETIVELLRLTPSAGTIAADDLMPVLIYVIIKANPVSLLSNMQYVESFLGDRMGSSMEECYWRSFAGAVQIIKKMLGESDQLPSLNQPSGGFRQ